MIPTTLHYRSRPAEQTQLRALPRAGDYLDRDGALWVMSAVILTGDEWHLYLVAVGDALAAELRAAWATWGESTAPIAPEASI